MDSEEMDGAAPAQIETMARPINFLVDVVGEEGHKRLIGLLEEFATKAVRLGFEEDAAWRAVDFTLMSLAWDHLLRQDGQNIFSTIVYEDPAQPPTTLTTQ